jgi:hypothetical protein
MAATTERLLAEIEELIRTMPAQQVLSQDSPESNAWLGRAAAVIEAWEISKGLEFWDSRRKLMSMLPLQVGEGSRRISMLLHQGRQALLLQGPWTGSLSVPSGMVFEYFDEIRKAVELATEDTLFVDPYLDAEFVSSIRLLAREKLATLLPAVDVFSAQVARKVEVRSAPSFHDRYLFIDRKICYQSGASFKDGAKKAPTTLTQIIDAFQAVSKTYEDLWTASNVER